ncbi:MAG TPA: chromosome segregation protein SMC, partial [Methylophilus sp.]
LSQKGLDGQARLWQAISVEPAWQVALEAVLGNKLNALISDQSRPTQRPPSALVLALPSSAAATPVKHTSLVALLDHVTCQQPQLQGLLQEWLSGVYVLAEEQDLAQALPSLSMGECLVNAAGDIYTQHSVSYYGAQNQLHGVLERQQQLAKLTQQQPALNLALAHAQQALTQHEQALQALRQQQVTESHALKQTTADLHAVQLTIARLKQAFEHAKSREVAIKADIEHAQHKQDQLTLEHVEKQSQLALLLADLPSLEQAAQGAASAQQLAEQAYVALRDALQKAEKSQHERMFNKKLIINKINELNSKIKVNSEEKSAYLHRQADAEHRLTLTPMDTLKANLNAALNKKQLAEAALAQARNHLAEQEQQLQTQEKVRLQQEQQLHPLRDQLEQSRLKEQQARLYFEQCQAALIENGIAEAVLAAGLTVQSKSSELANKTLQIQRKMNDLGAVNLAAIVELATEQERKTYLDSQMLDLSQASETLEDAIRKIDRETRGKLQATFDEANRNFNELFNVLFAGGQARLELLGEEILDTGIQVFAQPPGKKNTTIQMLSGGEKALTAMALVFALFRLNPAPFCLMDEVDAPLDDSNTERFCGLVKKMSERTQFLFVSHNKITMEMAQQLIGVTMQESGVSRVVDVDIEAALSMQAA